MWFCNLKPQFGTNLIFQFNQSHTNNIDTTPISSHFVTTSRFVTKRDASIESIVLGDDQAGHQYRNNAGFSVLTALKFCPGSPLT
jgi:hypothetical protein